jgi:hypothetical protein
MAEKDVEQHGGVKTDEIEAAVSMYALLGLWSMFDGRERMVLQMVRDKMEERSKH